MLSDNKIRVQENQTIWDIAKQEYGNVECVRQLVDDNPTVITSLDIVLAAGTKLNIQKDKTKVNGYNAEVVKSFLERGVKPAGEVLATIPALPPGALAWYKAWVSYELHEMDETNTIDNDVTVTFSRLWDFSGNGHHLTQAIKANQPELHDWDIITAKFDATGKFMSVNISPDFPRPVTVVGIFFRRGPGSSPSNVTNVVHTNSDHRCFPIQFNETFSTVINNDHSSEIGQPNDTTYDVYLIVSKQSNSGNNNELWVNGNPVQTITSAQSHGGNMIGLGEANNYCWDGELYEMLVYSGEDFSSVQVGQIFDYYMSIYGFDFRTL